MRYRYKQKKLDDGRAMLNIGCGTHTHWDWNNMDFSPYALLAHHRGFTKFLHAVGVLSDFRYKSVLKVDLDIIHWDIRKGIPFQDNVFDVVYHSHFITQLNRSIAAYVTRECYRVLKLGGIIRTVTPDLLEIVNRYKAAIRMKEKNDPKGSGEYEEAVDDFFELMVREDPVGTSKQNPLVRLLERKVRGNISNTGELRRWHYDQYSMGAMLNEAGFRDVRTMDPVKSRIEGFVEFCLDLNKDGSVYKPRSLYMEGIK